MKHLYFLFFLLLFFVDCRAQVDTEFWFAPPDVSSGHGDRPVYFRISTLDKAANVKIIQPARGNVVLGNYTIAANTTKTVDLTTSISYLETSLAATVMKTGIKIISSSPITAYYEVGSTWNTDIFALKGKNALGNKFVIPAQNLYNNSSDYSPLPHSSFDIVATQNNTVVKIKPTKPIYGHEGEDIITIKLNAGETYSLRKVSLLGADNPAGTVVESNKPVAITLKDDSVANGGCRDLLGDQLVPVKVAGLEYVVLRGFLDTSEYLFITATEDDTEIFINGSSTPATKLDAGEIFRYHIGSPSVYVLSNKTVYVFHVTGFGCELGMAILPSINCKGSQQIGFSRTTSEFFGLNVLVRKEGINSFKLNGSASLIPASSFTAVPGTNEKWYAAQLSFTTSQIQVGQASLISNDQYSFQVGIINGNASTTCRYGYFSAFSTLFIGDDYNICEGETAMLDAGAGKESYLWNTGATTQTIEVSNPGEYWVKVEKEECMLYDTINIDVKKGKIELGPDVSVCKNDTAKIDGKDNFSWLWSNGSEERYLNTTIPGKYWLSVHDNNGCTASDTIIVNLKATPSVDLGQNILKCPHEEVTFDASFPGGLYLWQDGDTAPVKTVTDSGTYVCKVFYNGCSAVDTVEIANLPGPAQDTIFGSPSVCPFVAGVGYEVEDVGNSVYQWFVEGGDIAADLKNKIEVDWKDANTNAFVKALVTDERGCKSDTLLFPVRVNANLQVEVPEGPDTLCLNKSDQVVYFTPETNGSVYTWKLNGGTVASGQGSNEVVIDWEKGLNKLWIEESSTTIDTVCQGVSPELSVYVFQDMAAVELKTVSVDTANEKNIFISWSVTHPERIQHDTLFLYKKPKNEGNWQLLASLPVSVDTYVDQGNLTDEQSYEYYIGVSNLCDEELLSAVHNTILLTGESDTVKDMISFSWTSYEGWTDGVGAYELWRKLDDSPGYEFVADLPEKENTFVGEFGSDGFNHQYIVRAVDKSGSRESWSNNIDFTFEHPIYVPNVFTPNGDVYNQFFYIPKIELYKNSELTVMDRWGRTVYETTGYRNDWEGNGLSTGVYYYILKLNRDNKVFKGTVSILR